MNRVDYWKQQMWLKFVTNIVLQFIGKVWSWLLKAANEEKIVTIVEEQSYWK